MDINFDPNENVSSFDRLYSKLPKKKYIVLAIKYSFRCIRLYKNYLHVIFNYYDKNFPIKAIMRNGSVIEANDIFHANFLITGTLHEYEIKDDLLIIHKKGFEGVKLWGWQKGTVFEVFANEDYSKLDVNGKDVIDIGSNIGDTAIYFLKLGARKIIGVEPSEENFSISVKNINENSLNDKVIMLKSAIGNQDCTKIVTGTGDGIMYKVMESDAGREMTFVTLGSLVKKFGVTDAVLKLDCEGAEYDAILSTERDVLRKFNELIIEYHYGYVNLKKKFEMCGFKVEVSRPLLLSKNQPHVWIGYLHAKRRD